MRRPPTCGGLGLVEAIPTGEGNQPADLIGYDRRHEVDGQPGCGRGPLRSGVQAVKPR